MDAFFDVVRYLELEEAIELLHMFAEFEGTPQEYEIQSPRDQPLFYQLWEFLPDDGEKAIALLMEGIEKEPFRDQAEAFLKGDLNADEEE